MQIWVGDLLMVINSPAFQWHSWRIGLSFWAWAQQVSVFILYNLFFFLSFLSLFTCQAFLRGLLSTMTCWALLSRVVYCSLDMKGQWNGHFNQLTAAWSKIPSSWLWLLFKVFFLFTTSSGAFDSHGVTKSLPCTELWAGSLKIAFDQGLALIRDGVRALSSSALLLGWCWRQEGRGLVQENIHRAESTGKEPGYYTLTFTQLLLLKVCLLEGKSKPSTSKFLSRV